ncbi:DNA-binding transcriptional response regulator [Stigmatella hybrida]|uniref:hypothetical protein n=1 Tax=Stigmatella hybrida TaxID=394097 RepID=UPI001CDB0A26|nr:hypothetical protein [Stigmatella hybrida]
MQDSAATEIKGLRRRAFIPGVLGMSSASGVAPVRLRSSPPDRAGSDREPSVLVIAEQVSVRNDVARELARNFEILHATHFTSALRKLAARPSVSAIILDLALVDGRGASWFLARLVDHAYEGPRILLSSVLGRQETSSQSSGPRSHFTLATPWVPGELRAHIDRALGTPCAAQRAVDM